MAVIFCNATTALAETPEKPFLKEFGVLSGYAKSDLKEDRHYNFIPVTLRFGLNLGNFSSKDLIELEVEPFASFVTSTDTNTEIGANLLLKYGYFLTDRICPYIEGGAGIVHQKYVTVSVNSHTSFLPQVGAGVSYFINKNVAVDAGYRFRHLSNAGIKEPNHGIDSDMWMAGISWFY